MAFEELVKILTRIALSKAEGPLPHECPLFDKESGQHPGPLPETIKHWRYDGKNNWGPDPKWANSHSYTCKTCGASKTWMGNPIEGSTGPGLPE